MVPTRALINQVSDDAAAALAERAVENVSITSVPVDLSVEDESKILYVVTQERLDVLLIANPNIRIDLVVIDEAQMISEGSRGVLLEAVMDRVGAIKNAPQVIFSGPLIENPSYFGELFDIKKFATSASNRSPVTQNIIFLDYAEQPDPSVSVKLLLDRNSIQVETIETPLRLITDIDRLSYMSMMFGRSGSSIVYAAGKADAEKIALKLALELSDDPARATALAELIGFVKKRP